MRNISLMIAIGALLVALAACGKLGDGGVMNKIVGNWAQVNLPSGCAAKQIAAEEHGGVAILCEDGRVFN